MKLFFCFMLLASSLTATAQITRLTVEIEGIKARKGKVLLALYTAEMEFLGEDIFRGREADIVDGKATVIFENLSYGRYALSSFFDKNANGSLDTNFIGIPKEPYAFSMNSKGSFGPPSFDDAAFSLSQSAQSITIRY